MDDAGPIFRQGSSSKNVKPVGGRRKKHNPKRGCGRTAKQRRGWMVYSKRHYRQIYHDLHLGSLRGMAFSVRSEKALVSMTLAYVAEVEVWLRSCGAHQAPLQSLHAFLAHLEALSPAMREASVLMEELLDLIIEGYEREFLCTAIMQSNAVFSVISALLSEPYLGGGRAAIQLLDQLGRWLLPGDQPMDPVREHFLQELLKVLAQASIGTCNYRPDAVLAMAVILRFLSAEACPRMVSFCGSHLLYLLQQPTTLADRSLGRAVALLAVVLVEQHDVGAVMLRLSEHSQHPGVLTAGEGAAGPGVQPAGPGVGSGGSDGPSGANVGPAVTGVVYASVGPVAAVVGPAGAGLSPAGSGTPAGAEGLGQAASAQQQPYLFVLPVSAFSGMLETIASTIHKCLASPDYYTKGCFCNTSLLELLWCLNICSHYNKAMAENFLTATYSISTLKLASEHFMWNDKLWLCSVALLQLINNIIVWMPFTASQICQSFGNLLCHALQVNIISPVTDNMRRSALSLAASFMKTPHHHATAGCVMSDAALMNGLASAIERASW